MVGLALLLICAGCLTSLTDQAKIYNKEVLGLVHIAYMPWEWYSLGMSGMKRGSKPACGTAWVEKALRFLQSTLSLPLPAGGLAEAL